MLKFLVGPNKHASFPDTPLFVTIYGLVWSSPVRIYPYNSLCSHAGEMHCKAKNGVVKGLSENLFGMALLKFMFLFHKQT